MRTVRTLILVLIGAIAVGACSESPDSVDEAVSSLPDEEDFAELRAEIEAEIEELSTEIESSEAADDLRDAWVDMQAELDAAMDSIESNESIDTEEIRSQLEEFQTEVEAAGEEASDELVAVWNRLRSRFEQLIS